MKTKIVYALTSTEKDIYLEQTLVSLISLRKYNENAYVALMVDDQTDKTLVGFRSTILNYVNEKIVVATPQDYTQIQRSRYIKTTLRHHINGPLLFIDGDTLIASELNDIDKLLEQDIQLAMVADYHIKISDDTTYKFNITEKLNQLGWHLTENDSIYFNSGVIFVNDTELTHHFFNSWNNNWKLKAYQGCYLDQPSLAKTNQDFNHIISELNGIWNCQIIFNGIRFLYKAKIIHYFSSLTNNNSPYYFANKRCFIDIKQNKTIPSTTMWNIHNPQEAFCEPVNIIPTKESSKFINSPMYSLYKSNYRYYRFIEYLAYNFYRLFFLHK